ncbi:hypothetical protein NDA18_002467 [Ustilago nuda]|nr:hypothetical protein NDA18_002467 [Ustilago nuda]
MSSNGHLTAVGRTSNGTRASASVDLSTHRHTTTTHPHRSAASAFQLPGHAIYLADPHRLSVLSIHLEASTTISTFRVAPSKEQDQSLAQQGAQLAKSLHPPSPNGYGQASSSKLHSPQPPPSSFTSSSFKSGRTRPLSNDFGQKARDALSEFGRLASRRTSAIERSNGAHTLARVADGLSSASTQTTHSTQSSHIGRASLQPSPLQQGTFPSTSSYNASNTGSTNLASDDAVVVRSSAKRYFVLTPQHDQRLTAHTIPLSIESHTTAPDQTLSQSAPVEFVLHSAKHTDSTGPTNGLKGDLAASSFDPARLLLKVRPPAEHARHAWSRDATFITFNNASQYITSEDSLIQLRFRLRLCASSTTPTSPSFPRNTPEHGLGQVLFLSAASPERLTTAIESPHATISTPELATLEGITRVEVVPPSCATPSSVARGAQDCDFDWTWKSLTRSFSERGSRCCCAFVELQPDGRTAQTLAAFSFHIEVPVSTAAQNIMPTSNGAASASQPGISRADSMALIAALNLDRDLSPHDEVPPQQSSSRILATTDDAASKSTKSHPRQESDCMPLLIDRTELALEDVVNDSPIFRAAITNLERRTASMKKVSKAVFKSAQEARLRILKLVEAEEAMDAAFEGLVALAPETIGRLQDQFLRQARSRIVQHRREQANVIETCLERPLSQVVELCRVAQEGFKLFDNESKTYYSQTQKWLANRSNVDASPVPLGSEEPTSAFTLERFQKQDRADEKQKLREMRFEQARFDLYAMLQRLHGGRAEAHLAQCVLQLSQWLADLPTTLFGRNSTVLEQQSSLLTLDSGLREALDDHALQLEEVEARSRRLGDKIRSLEQALGRAGDTDVDIVGAHKFELEQEAPQPSAANGAIASKARKFKSFLGAFAAGINSSPLNSSKSPNPDAIEPPKQTDPLAVNGKNQGPSLDPQRRLSLKLKADRGQQVDASPSSPAKSQAPSSWKFDNMPATARRGSELLHEAAKARNGNGSDVVVIGWRSSPNAVRPASDAGSSAAGGHEISDVKGGDQGLGIFAPSSPSSVRLADRGGTSAAAASSSIAPGGDRKKEGVLWVMSKSVTGPTGSGAPRVVNRSAHWRESWVVLSGSGQISEYADWKNAKALEPTNPLIDLRFATVREARGVDRRFAFEIVTRDSRRFFQASDEESMRDWMRAISKAIESLLNGTSSVRKLDRVVRASPFGSSDPAQRAGIFEETEDEFGAGEGNDFAVRRLLDGTGKAFSQSMTDLSGSAKSQTADRKGQPKLGEHLATLSESHAEVSARSSKRRSRHERGISNKTPISGYLGAGGLGLSAADAAALHTRDGTGVSDEGFRSSLSANGEHDTEFDRQIESAIHRSYGSHDDTGTSNSGFSQNSTTGAVDEIGMFKGKDHSNSLDSIGQANAQGVSSTLSSRGRNNVNGSVASTATSTKMSRSAEIAAISRQPENRRCADCQDNDPRWASWMLANEPCCIFICIGCSGVHRSLGVHISKVKSVDLDDWTEEQLHAARDWGNARANALWEYSKPFGLLPSLGDRKEFWRMKYVEQKWKAPPTTQPAQSSQQNEPAVVEDMDATPTRRSVLMNDASTIANSSSERRSQSHAKAIGLRIAPVDQHAVSATPTKFAERLASPKPNGPRPLPNRRSVSMQSVPTNSPPQSPLGPDQLYSINEGLRSPTSPSTRQRFDWTVEQTSQPRASEEQTADFQKHFAAPSMLMETSPGKSDNASLPVSASVPYLSNIGSRPYVSQAMLATRADPRLFPSEAPQLAPTDSKTQSISSSPSSFFVSNLDGPSRSPLFFDGSLPGEESSWDTGSEADNFDGRISMGESPTDAPARFEPYSASHA